MSYSSPSSFVVDANSNTCMQTTPKPLGNAHKFQADGHFGFSEHVQNSNFMSDSIYIQDGPRAVSISETGEIHRLAADEDIEISGNKNQFYKSPIDDGKKVSQRSESPQEPQRKRRSKSAKNSENRLNQKLRPIFTPRISRSFHSQQDLRITKSTTSSMATQTHLEGDAVTMAQHSSRISIPPTSFYRETCEDFRRIITIFSTVTILLWLASIYFELKTVAEICEYVLKKIRGVYVKSDPPRSKYEIAQEFLTKLFL